MLTVIAWGTHVALFLRIFVLWLRVRITLYNVFTYLLTFVLFQLVYSFVDYIMHLCSNTIIFPFYPISVSNFYIHPAILERRQTCNIVCCHIFSNFLYPSYVKISKILKNVPFVNLLHWKWPPSSSLQIKSASIFSLMFFRKTISLRLSLVHGPGSEPSTTLNF